MTKIYCTRISGRYAPQILGPAVPRAQGLASLAGILCIPKLTLLAATFTIQVHPPFPFPLFPFFPFFTFFTFFLFLFFPFPPFPFSYFPLILNRLSLSPYQQPLEILSYGHTEVGRKECSFMYIDFLFFESPHSGQIKVGSHMKLQFMLLIYQI